MPLVANWGMDRSVSSRVFDAGQQLAAASGLDLAHALDEALNQFLGWPFRAAAGRATDFDGKWSERLIDSRHAIEHQGWLLPRIRYSETSGAIHTEQPQISGQPVCEFVIGPRKAWTKTLDCAKFSPD